MKETKSSTIESERMLVNILELVFVIVTCFTLSTRAYYERHSRSQTYVAFRE